jgi:hypothetical protein
MKIEPITEILQQVLYFTCFIIKSHTCNKLLQGLIFRTLILLIIYSTCLYTEKHCDNEMTYLSKRKWKYTPSLLDVFVTDLAIHNEGFYASRKNSGEHIIAGLSVRPSGSQSVRTYVCTSRIRVRPITLLSEVGFYNYLTKMITILRRRVARNIRVPTLKVKVTA